MIFNPKPNHQYVGNLSHEKQRNREEDSDLYYDTDTKTFFIVDSVEDDNGFTSWYSHSIRQIEGIFEGSEIGGKIESLMRDHLSQQS
ncbi:hypothetical protein TA3x_005576 [Tundrisphaera sp. TA3]|uniref:hypothetical protein n=1 Tax=Tundrisphaera sp. TA3 TaxID=3435775 RepID=UPI003EB77AD8